MECNQYEEMRSEWRERWRERDDDMMEGVLGYVELEREMEKLVLKSVGEIWKERKRREF